MSSPASDDIDMDMEELTPNPAQSPGHSFKDSSSWTLRQLQSKKPGAFSGGGVRSSGRGSMMGPGNYMGVGRERGESGKLVDSDFKGKDFGDPFTEAELKKAT